MLGSEFVNHRPSLNEGIACHSEKKIEPRRKEWDWRSRCEVDKCVCKSKTT